MKLWPFQTSWTVKNPSQLFILILWICVTAALHFTYNSAKQDSLYVLFSYGVLLEAHGIN